MKNEKTTNFGVHLTIDGYKGDELSLSDMFLIFNSLNELPEKLGMKKLNPPIPLFQRGNLLHNTPSALRQKVRLLRLNQDK